MKHTHTHTQLCNKHISGVNTSVLIQKIAKKCMIKRLLLNSAVFVSLISGKLRAKKLVFHRHTMRNMLRAFKLANKFTRGTKASYIW